MEARERKRAAAAHARLGRARMELRRGSSGRNRTREDLEVAGAEPARWEWAKNACGSGVHRCGAARPG
jgi:hypothetical protein